MFSVPKRQIFRVQKHFFHWKEEWGVGGRNVRENYCERSPLLVCTETKNSITHFITEKLNI